MVLLGPSYDTQTSMHFFRGRVPFYLHVRFCLTLRIIYIYIYKNKQIRTKTVYPCTIRVRYIRGYLLEDAVLRGIISVSDILYFRNCRQFVGFLCKA